MRFALALLMINACGFLTTCSQMPSALDQVIESGLLRVVTRNASTTHYFGTSGPTGLEFDLAQGFADYLGVDLELYNAEEFTDILGDVANWRADMAAAGLTITPSRASQYAFSDAYHSVNQVLVYRMGRKRPKSIEDVLPGQISVTGGSSFVETLLALQLEHPQLHWSEMPDAASVEELLQRVAGRELEYTIVDSNDLDINRNYFPSLRVGFELATEEQLGWAFRQRPDSSLRDAANAYLAELKKSGKLDELKARYFDRNHSLDYVGTRKFIRDVKNRLLRYQPVFEQAGDENEVDWHLLAAQSYQESHWNPKAVSPTGVRGLMMLTQATARQMGVVDRTDPRESILGGARYLTRLKAKLPERIPEPDRTYLALAAYNVGFGHLEDARILTQKGGLNPDSWEDVAKFLPLLAQKKWYQQTRRGYARGWEPVIYVDNIRSYYGIMEWAMSDRNPSARWFDQQRNPDNTVDDGGAGEVSALP
ncbi:MAG: membrane-bound lytic murein transglycosylase MltF [Gammaproteobacteria bacterium]